MILNLFEKDDKKQTQETLNSKHFLKLLSKLKYSIFIFICGEYIFSGKLLGNLFLTNLKSAYNYSFILETIKDIQRSQWFLLTSARFANFSAKHNIID